MKRVFLIRHGEKKEKRGDVSLTETGRQQALKTGRALSKKNIGLILSSPSKRCVQTAEIISQTLARSYEINSALKERIYFGDIKNQTYAEYLELCRLSTVNRDFILPNGETSINTGNRIKSVIDGNEGIILLVTHGGAIADYVRNIFEEKVIRKKWGDFFRFYAIPYCSITQIDIKKNFNSTLILLGSTKHLL